MISSLHSDALLFDLDGVLVDSAECVRHVCSAWAVQHGLDPAQVLAAAQGRRVQETVRAVAPHLDIEAEVAALVATEARTTDGLYQIPGTHSLLASIPSDAWAVVTSGARRVAALRLSHVGLPIPQTLITADDVRHGKPDPEGYLAAAQRLGVTPNDCIVVEDAPAGIAAARAAGMRCVAVAGTFPPSRLVDADVVLPELSRLTVTVSAGRPRLHLRI